MKFDSKRSLLLFSSILIVVGASISSPSGKFFVIGIALLLALPTVIFGSGYSRVSGVVIALLASALMAASFGAMKRDQENYSERVKANLKQAPLSPEPSGVTE